MVTLVTERLTLREFVAGDWPAVLHYQSDPRYTALGYWRERDAESVRDFVGRFLDAQRRQPRDVYQLAVVRTAGGQLIGNCGVRINDRTLREGNIGYELDPDHWGRGYATEAARAILAYGFAELRLHRIWAECLAHNAASARVLDKLGLRVEGRLREQAFVHDEWRDNLLYAILDHEWAPPPSPCYTLVAP